MSFRFYFFFPQVRSNVVLAKQNKEKKKQKQKKKRKKKPRI